MSSHFSTIPAPQVRILEESGQLPLAYVAAATHGLHEEAERIGQALGELPDLPDMSQLLLPPTPILKVGRGGVQGFILCRPAQMFGAPSYLPGYSREPAPILLIHNFCTSDVTASSLCPEVLTVCGLVSVVLVLPSSVCSLSPQEDNWPLLTVSKGFFELLAAKGRAEAAAGKTSSGGAAAGASAMAGGLEDGALDGAGWGGDDDLDLGGGAGGGGGEGGEGGDEEGGWDMEDLEISPEVMAEAAASAAAGAAGTSGPFVVPAAGTPASAKWLEKRTQLAVDHIAAGSFQSAMSLLFRQLGAAGFEPLRPYFMDIYSASHASMPGLPGAPSMLAHLDRSFSADAASAPPTAPALIYTLKQLEESLKAAYKLVTEGKFTDALKVWGVGMDAWA